MLTHERPLVPTSDSIDTTRVKLSALVRMPARGLQLIWSDRWIGVASTVVIAAVTGLLVALTMPRGPVTTAQALSLMAAGVAVGVVAGLALRSRWAMLLAPVVHVATFEFGRRGTDGPTVDGISFGTSFEILAFILGRGFYALIGLFPMVLGVAYGAALARRFATSAAAHRGRRVGRYARATGGGLSTVALIGLAVLIAWPASTPAIAGPDGERLPGSIASLEEVRLGGHDQTVLIRGASVDNPVVLWLNGGPGQSGLGFTRALFEGLAQDFVVVDWDQRGAGKSYPALDPTSTWTLDQAVADTVALTNELRDRFDEEKIYLAGVSWGTTLGVLAVQQHPELFHAYIGAGQMVSELETDRRLYRDVLAYAEQTGDSDLADQMRAYGEPPYDDVWANAFVMQQYEELADDYTAPPAYVERGDASGIGPFGVLASEYTFVDKVNVLRGLMDTFAVMYPQLQGIDFRRDVPRLDVPVYIVAGEYELAARRDLALEWFDLLQAPSKRRFTLDDSGHSVAFEQFGEFHRIMVETVLPETYPNK